ncbi:MAG: alpha/beta hydrolase, partial [Vulcanimicrobiaceae bacterium]
MKVAQTIVLTALLGAAAFAQTPTPDPHTLPVKAVGPRSFLVTTTAGSGEARYFGTSSLDGDARAVRAILVFHGLLRDAEVYEAGAEKALHAAGPLGDGTVLFTPQFLSNFDVTAHALPANTLAWNWEKWQGGEPALGPAPLSAFDVIDAMIARLSDRTRFPRLREIVLAGHSAGGQLVQRYAVVGHPQLGTPVRYVVANPSSYLYFTADRAQSNGTFAPYTGTACPHFN